MQKIKPFLWFDGQAEEAAKLYTSVFNNSKVLSVSRYPEGAPEPAGTVMTVEFVLDGQHFIALNGGPLFKFTEAISFFVTCSTQKEIDRCWKKLSARGEPGRCGWLKDRFGVSWQIIPPFLTGYLSDDDTEKSGRVMQAMLKMRKLDIKKLKAAYAAK
jgi:predicted 3-demethylubiquinone-9 3-methyltransferase (glyoxalase superfamily)